MIKLYTGEIAKSVADEFTDYLDGNKLIGNMVGFPLLESFKQAKSTDPILIITPPPERGITFDFQENNIIYNIVYQFDVMIFVKLSPTNFVWKDRLNLGQKLTNEISNWAKNIEGKIFIDNFNKITTAQVKSLDYFCAKYMNEDLLKTNYVAVAVEMLIETEFNEPLYRSYLARRKD